MPEKALIFGGDTLTTTDVAVALGKAELGDPSKVAHLDKELLEKVYGKMVEMVEEAIDKIKTSAAPTPVILVGGGSILFPTELKGASQVIRPEHSGVANAIGSAISQVSGQIEKSTCWMKLDVRMRWNKRRKRRRQKQSMPVPTKTASLSWI